MAEKAGLALIQTGHFNDMPVVWQTNDGSSDLTMA
jgi:hypothetical protein